MKTKTKRTKGEPWTATHESSVTSDAELRQIMKRILVMQGEAITAKKPTPNSTADKA